MNFVAVGLGLVALFVSSQSIGRDGQRSRKDFTFDLPTEQHPIPEPLAAGERPGFAIRGIKGWKWTPEQYFKIVPFLVAHKMNFLMNCYTNMSDIEHFAWGDPKGNRWWEPVQPEKKRWLERLVRECQTKGVQFCFSMNPSLFSPRPLHYDSKVDFEALWQHYAWMQSLGVRWFNVSLDDISEGIDGEGQVRLVNEIVHRLRVKDPQVQFIFCPTWYWGNGQEPDKQSFFSRVSKELDKDVYVFWTGDQVIGPITRKAAKSYKEAVNHRLFLWDNYPVNDDNPTMHLGPVIRRDPDLCDVIDGYMSNSMCQEGDANRIPLLTCADYAYNPKAYDAKRSIGQSILSIASNGTQRALLRELVLAYPGDLLHFEGTYNSSFNSVREQFSAIMAGKHSHYAAEVFCDRIEQIAIRLKRAFPSSFGAERAVVEADVTWMRKQLASR